MIQGEKRGKNSLMIRARGRQITSGCPLYGKLEYQKERRQIKEQTNCLGNKQLKMWVEMVDWRHKTLIKHQRNMKQAPPYSAFPPQAAGKPQTAKKPGKQRKSTEVTRRERIQEHSWLLIRKLWRKRGTELPLKEKKLTQTPVKHEKGLSKMKAKGTDFQTKS